MAEKSKADLDLSRYVPNQLRRLDSLDLSIPKIVKEEQTIRVIEEAARAVPTKHDLYLHDSRNAKFLLPNSVHLVITSPPYWTLKRYREVEGQLGHVADYSDFLSQLDKVWKHCFRSLVPGGRLVCVVGDVCLSRRKNNGEHTVIPLHSSIQEHCRKIGYSNLAPIIWYKISNASYEVGNGGGFLGKPYEPNAIVKNDIEYILMLRKPGGYRKPTYSNRILSVISGTNHKAWFQQIWTNVPGASTKDHPAPYPLELVERLIRMYSFVGDTVLDPFMGTASTNLASALWGRNSIGIELDPHYFNMAYERMQEKSKTLFSVVEIETHT